MKMKSLITGSGYEFPKGAESAAPLRVEVSDAALRTITKALDKLAVDGGCSAKDRLRLLGLAELLDGVRKALDLYPNDEYLVGFKRLHPKVPRSADKKHQRRRR